MEIKVNPVIGDNKNNPAVGFRVFVGLVNTDPKTEANRIPLTSGPEGVAVANPFIVGSDGYARNTDGQIIFPNANVTEYSVEFRSSQGEFGARLYRNPRVVSDAFSSSAATNGEIVDIVVNNFTVALTTDLSLGNLIFVQSFNTAWEGTAEGPQGAFFAYKTGNTGTPSTGNPGVWFDSAGNEFKPAQFQRLYAEMFGAKVGIANDSFEAIQDMVDAGVALAKPIYFDGDDYFIGTQTNTDANYSLIAFFAVKITGDLAIYGGGKTKIVNKNPNDDQFMFFAEDVDNLCIKDIILDANSTVDGTGALYLAGVDNADLDITVKNSAPIYMSASTTRQSGNINYNFNIVNSVQFGVSGKSGGFKTAQGNINYINCNKGFEVSRADIDGFLLSFVDPFLTVPSSTGDVTNEVFNVSNGSLEYGSIAVAAGTAFIATPDTDDINLIQGGDITGCVKTFECTSTGGGVVKKVEIDSVYALGVTDGIEIDNALQLVEEFTIRHLDMTGDGSGSAVILGDDTQLGNVRILGGIVTGFLNGILINQTNGQNLFSELFIEDTTNAVVNATKSKLIMIGREYIGRINNPSGGAASWSGIQVSDWEFEELGSGTTDRVKITHNLGHTDYHVVAIAIVAATGTHMTTIYSLGPNDFVVIIASNTFLGGIDDDFTFKLTTNY